MSTLPVLVKALAEVDGRDRATLDYFGRTIREAGYITTGKRGMGAAKVTFHEAVNLLIGLHGADTAQEAPIAIDRFRSLRQFMTGTGNDIRAHLKKYDDYPQPIKDVMDVHTFGEALDALMEGTPDLVLACLGYFAEAYPDLPTKLFMDFVKLGQFGLLVTFGRYSGKIEMFRHNGSQRIVDFEATFMADPGRIKEGFYGQRATDRKVTVTIGLPTLIAAWEALHPDSEIAGTAGGGPL